MRTKLHELDGQRLRFRATVGRSGTASGWKTSIDSTVLLHNIKTASDGRQLTDHIWFKCGLWARTLQEGCIIEFDARVQPYIKGYFHDQIDYHLTRPTKLAFIGGKPPLTLPPEKPRTAKANQPKETPASTTRQREFIQELQEEAQTLIPDEYGARPHWQRDPEGLNIKEASELISEMLPLVQNASAAKAMEQKNTRNADISQRLANGEPAKQVAEEYGLKPATVRTIAREHRKAQEKSE